MTILRAALYERVSTEEQALHGYSIQTQRETLEEFCNEKGYKIVGHYTDEGISGAKPPLKRPALKQLLDDVAAGKIDIILFTKLDRWFRSIEQYYKVQEILERYNVAWKTILEDYNTDTADGRLKVNIMLSVAANERERTSERIKVVMQNKWKNKVAAFGGAHTTMGYIRQKDENGVWRLVKDPETQHIIEEFWDMMIKYNNLYKVGSYINNKYHLNRADITYRRIRDNELYTGEYRGTKGFCEPYISREEWLRIKDRPNVKKTPKNKTYIFTGLVRCPDCGGRLASYYSLRDGQIKHKGYRCARGKFGNCTYKNSVSEKKIEKFLLNGLIKKLEQNILDIETRQAAVKKQPKTDTAKLKEKLRKLNVIYMAGGKTDEEYLREAAELKALIDKANQEPQIVNKDLTPLKELLKTDWKALYTTMDEEHRRAFWRGLIKVIYVKGNNVIDFELLDE